MAKFILAKSLEVLEPLEMEKTTELRKPQINFQLEGAEMADLETICSKENIARPSVLVAIWVRENIKQHNGDAVLMEVVREARQSGVDVIAVLAAARSAQKNKKGAVRARR